MSKIDFGGFNATGTGYRSRSASEPRSYEAGAPPAGEGAELPGHTPMPDAAVGSAMDHWVLLGRLRAPLVQGDRSRFRLRLSLLYTCERMGAPDMPGSPDVTVSSIAPRVDSACSYGVIRRLKNISQIARRLLNDRSRRFVPRLACPAVPAWRSRGGAGRPRGMRGRGRGELAWKPIGGGT